MCYLETEDGFPTVNLNRPVYKIKVSLMFIFYF